MELEQIFYEVRNASIRLWRTHDNTHGYADDKIRVFDRVSPSNKRNGDILKDIMFIFNMFDYGNQQSLLRMVSPETKNVLEKYCLPERQWDVYKKSIIDNYLNTKLEVEKLKKIYDQKTNRNIGI